MIKKLAGEVVTGLKTQPTLLGIVVLNIVAVVMAAWFLDKLAEGNRAMIDRLMSACFPPSHQRGNFGE